MVVIESNPVRKMSWLSLIENYRFISATQKDVVTNNKK